MKALNCKVLGYGLLDGYTYVGVIGSLAIGRIDDDARGCCCQYRVEKKDKVEDRKGTARV